MQAPLPVSVVIPLHNGEQHIGEAIESVLSQRCRAAELIVVDDASSDDGAQVAEKAGATVLRTPQNKGPSHSRNQGIREAKSELIAFLDADDRWLPDHLERAVSCLAEQPEAGVAFSGFRLFGSVTAECPVTVRANQPLDLSSELLWANHVLQSTAVARRAVLLAVGGYDESRRYSEDFELWLRLSMGSKFVATGAITVEYRTHPAQVTARQACMYQGAWEARADHLARLLRRDPAAKPRLTELLQRRWEEDLRLAWRERDDSILRSTLSLDQYVPDSAPIAARWQRRLRFQRPAWRAMAWVYDRMPILQRWARRRRQRAGAGA